MTTQTPYSVAHKQQGAALITSLILLVVITMLSLAAARSANLDTKVSINHQYKQLAFQAAENAFAKLLTTSPANMTLPGVVGDTVSSSAFIPLNSSVHSHADLALTLIDDDAPGLTHGSSVSGKTVLYRADATGRVSDANAIANNQMQVILER